MSTILEKLAVIGVTLAMVFGGLISCTRYATEYDLETNDAEYGVYDKWNVCKREMDGQVYLDVWYSGSYKTSEEKCWFRVYDSDMEASKAYNAMKESYEDFCGLTDEGINWFIGQTPNVCDATIDSMVYLRNNIIIIAELEVWGESAWEEDDNGEWIQAEGGYTDNTGLKDYIPENASEMEEFVMEDILGY